MPLCLTEAQKSTRRTVRPEHMLLALVSTESFLTLQLNESGFDKESLAQAMSSIRNEERLSIMDKMQCVLFAWLHANMPPYSSAFYLVLKWARLLVSS